MIEQADGAKELLLEAMYEDFIVIIFILFLFTAGTALWLIYREVTKC